MEILGGPLFGVAGAGESHGPAISTIVFGCPPGLWVERASVQHYLDRRRPGGNKLGTPRREDDKVVFLSGLYGEDHERLLSGPQHTFLPAESGLENVPPNSPHHQTRHNPDPYHLSWLPFHFLGTTSGTTRHD